MNQVIFFSYFWRSSHYNIPFQEIKKKKGIDEFKNWPFGVCGHASVKLDKVCKRESHAFMPVFTRPLSYVGTRSNTQINQLYLSKL